MKKVRIGQLQEMLEVVSLKENVLGITIHRNYVCLDYKVRVSFPQIDFIFNMENQSENEYEGKYVKSYINIKRMSLNGYRTFLWLFVMQCSSISHGMFMIPTAIRQRFVYTLAFYRS